LHLQLHHMNINILSWIFLTWLDTRIDTTNTEKKKNPSTDNIV